MFKIVRKVRGLFAFLRRGMNQEDLATEIRRRFPTLAQGGGFVVRSLDRFAPGPSNHVDHNVYIHCGEAWSGGRGYFRSGRNCVISANTVVYAAGGVELGDHVSIGPNCTIVSHQQSFAMDGTPYKDQEMLYAPVKIGNNVALNSGATILPGVTIGDNAIVGASALVTRDVPANSVVMGIPAKVVRTF
jgi:acetyltransferase-like isoleucine patch superfamily enzyme